MLSGKKTYLAALLLALATFAKAAGWLDTQQYEVIMGILSGLGLAALRAGVKKASGDY
jgi:hypothetical protein